MPRGGPRPGSGRPKGSTKAKKAADIAAVILETMTTQAKTPQKAPEPPPPPLELPESITRPYDDPRDFLKAVMNEPKIPMITRQDAAKALMPYMHAKKGETGKKEAATEKAKETGASRFGAVSPPPLRAVGS